MTITVPPPSAPVVEITVTSLQGLNNYTSFLIPTIKPFITLSTHVGSTSAVAEDTQKLRVALDPTFFSDVRSCLHLQLFTKRRILGPAQLGWCLIPAHDIGLLPPGSVRYLSYRLRGRDGARGHVIVNLSVRLENAPSMSTSLSPTMDTCHAVIGIPVTAIRGARSDYCSRMNRHEEGEVMYNTI
ncbi:hypothetical protein E2542_SST17681 [Spatholobus suberectus]|nr:hypothetical protein E2542_SST17681 [Spatholobus suberectus]